MSSENVRAHFANAKEAKTEPPRPLMRELPPADPFPVDALGDVLAPAARAIHDRVQAPTCNLRTVRARRCNACGSRTCKRRIANGPRRKPLSSYFVSIAATGERKSAVDQEALWPVRKREAALRENSAGERLEYENNEDAWEKAREAASKEGEGRSRPDQGRAGRTRPSADTAA